MNYALSWSIPPQLCVTRRSSDYSLLKHVISNLAKLNATVTVRKPALLLSQREVQILSDIADLLSFFLETTDILEGEKSNPLQGYSDCYFNRKCFIKLWTYVCIKYFIKVYSSAVFARKVQIFAEFIALHYSNYIWSIN